MVTTKDKETLKPWSVVEIANGWKLMEGEREITRVGNFGGPARLILQNAANAHNSAIESARAEGTKDTERAGYVLAMRLLQTNELLDDEVTTAIEHFVSAERNETTMTDKQITDNLLYSLDWSGGNSDHNRSLVLSAILQAKESQQAEIAALREALEKIAEGKTCCSSATKNCKQIARAALSETKSREEKKPDLL